MGEEKFWEIVGSTKCRAANAVAPSALILPILPVLFRNSSANVK